MWCRMSATLAWTLNRLKAMGPAEVFWRVRQAAAAGFERRGFGLAHDVGEGGDSASAAWVSPLPTNIRADLYVQVADRLLAGRWNVFSLRDWSLGFPPRWN